MMALALTISFTLCKKEQPVTPQSEDNTTVTISLDVKGNNNAKVEVDPPHVTFENGDVIYVASGGHYVGTLTHNGTCFSGSITNPTEGELLYFYFLGNKTPTDWTTNNDDETIGCTVNISDQTNELPVISMAPSTVKYSASISSYSASLHNQCSLMKFNVDTPSTAPICITGMNNLVTVNFATNSFTYDKDGAGIIKMAGGSSAERWIIVLQQSALAEGAIGSAYSVDYSYLGVRPVLDAISTGLCYSAGVNMTVNTASNSIEIGGSTFGGWTNDGGDPWDDPTPGSGGNTFGGWTNDGNDPWGN